MAGDEGFEPPQTESESGVLPLHKSPIYRAFKAHYYYMQFFSEVKTFFKKSKKFFDAAACRSSFSLILIFLNTFFNLPVL